MTHQTYFKDKTYSRKKKKRSKTKEEEAHLNNVASLSCAVCGDTAVEVHHKTGAGMGLRASHFETMPLCVNHHRGQEGIHTIGRKQWEELYGTQDDLIQWTQQQIEQREEQ